MDVELTFEGERFRLGTLMELPASLQTRGIAELLKPFGIHEFLLEEKAHTIEVRPVGDGVRSTEKALPELRAL